MTVQELIEKLKKYPKDYKVIFYQSGAVHDDVVTKVHISHYDKKHDRKQVTLTNH